MKNFEPTRVNPVNNCEALSGQITGEFAENSPAAHALTFDMHAVTQATIEALRKIKRIPPSTPFEK